ncbi:MAG: hypothetical protein V3U82_06900 [Robiginitomaculum sp.]
MADSKVNDVLSVLAITVIIDQHIRTPELTEFKTQAEGLAILCCPDLTQERAKAWFDENEPHILDSMESRGRNTVILKAITAIKDEMIRENLYDAMIAISISDKEYHKQESDLVRSAAVIWGFTRPPFKVVTTA